MVMKDRQKFVESKEGFTYMNKTLEEKISPRLLTFMLAPELLKWNK